jgi:electron transfer flavoprotein alpha subunit
MLLSLVESENGTVSAASAGALEYGRGLTGQLGIPLEAATFAPAHQLKDEVGAYGVATLHIIEHDEAPEYAPECWGEALAQLVRCAAPAGVLAAATDRGNELMAHVAARADLPLAASCVAVAAEAGEAENAWTLTRQRAGGVLLEDAELEATVKLVTLAPGAAPPATETAPVSSVALETFTPRLDGTLVRSTMAGHTARDQGISLATAPVVVSGGRGVGSAEGFAALEELAGLLGGAVGCSRVVTNNGWRPHSDQVGLTGTKIAPALYIACGISGASQHWVGCMDAARILAINTDPEAPMVTRASYAVIGDVAEVLDAVIAELRRRSEGAAERLRR